MFRKVFLVFCLVWLMQSISASYISGDIYIRGNGDVSFFVESDTLLNFSGLTYDENKVRGITSILTDKEGGKWIFGLDLDSYDTILLDIHLPESLKAIHSIDSEIVYAIDTDAKTINLIDSNKALVFSVEYSTSPVHDFSWVYFLVILVICVGGVYAFFRWKGEKQRIKDVFPLINDKEQKIIENLMKKPMRQKELRNLLGIPKSSFTRYVLNLEKKKLIFREGEGRNKILKLK